MAASLLWSSLAIGQEQTFLRQIDDSLHLQSDDGYWHADLSGQARLDAYFIDQRPPGLLFAKKHRNKLIYPALTLYLDANAGNDLYFFSRLSVDRGLDPGYMPHGDIRADEWMVRYTPFESPAFNIQAGKFATAFGSYVHRHEAWQNPFINAPFPYENVTNIGDEGYSLSTDDFLARRNRPLGDNKKTWVPAIWGPSYAHGIAVLGRHEKLAYALEVKNASLSSRPLEWKLRNRGYGSPTFTSRVGYHPNAAWTLGASASHGGYLQENRGLPGGRDPNDFKQTVLGIDVGYAHHHLQIWSEVVASKFDVLNVGSLETLAYYIEAKQKWNSRFYTGVRWNQQFFEDVTNAVGQSVSWDRDAWRAELAFGYRLSSHALTKIQYGYSRLRGDLQQGEQLVAAQLLFTF